MACWWIPHLVGILHRNIDIYHYVSQNSVSFVTDSHLRTVWWLGRCWAFVTEVDLGGLEEVVCRF